MTRLRICTFGGFEARLRHANAPLTFRTRKAIALTAYLAVRGNGPSGREDLGETLWGGVAPEQSRHSVRQALLDIRHALGPEASPILATTPDAARFDLGRIHVDVRTFERAIRRNSPQSIALACTLYRGDFLAGLHVREPAFDHWMQNERNRLRQLAADALQQRIGLLLEIGETASALQTALRLLELDPFHEWGHRAILTAYVRRGQLATAQRHYTTFASQLKQELDVDPEPETRDLLRRLLRTRGGRG